MGVWLKAAFVSLVLSLAHQAWAESFDPPSNDDLRSVSRSMDAIAVQARACAEALDTSKEQCLRRDCGAGQRLFAEIGDLDIILNALKTWQERARKDAREHHEQLLDAALKDGKRQAELEKLLAWESFFQNFGKLMLNAADFIEFAKGAKDNFKDIEAYLRDPEAGDLAQFAATIDWLDSIQDMLMNVADTAMAVAGALRDKEIELPPWLDGFLTLRQAATDIKDIAKGIAEGVTLARKARALAREAGSYFGADRASRLANAQKLSEQAGEKFSSGRAAFGQLVGKVLLAVAQSQQDAMKDEIADIQKNSDASIVAITEAFRLYGSRVTRATLIEDAIAALRTAQAPMGKCLSLCIPSNDPHEKVKIQGFQDAEDKEQYGKALTYLNGLLNDARARLAAAYAGYTPKITPAEAPRIASFHPSQAIAPGGRIRMDYDVDECTAEGEADAGGGSVALGGRMQGQVILKAPDAPGPIILTFKRNGETQSSQPLGLSVEEDAKLEDCGQINCDCDNLDWGLLTQQYREQCVAVEDSLKAECAAKGFITGSCDEVAQGPYAFPP